MRRFLGVFRELTAVTPMRNEAETVPIFEPRLINSLRANSENWKIIVPLTATDNTAEILGRYPVDIVNVPPGLGRAYKAGLSKALDVSTSGPILTMDTDLSHLPEEMGRLLGQDADLVLGARVETNSPFHRRVVSGLVNGILLGPYTDYTSAYRLYSRRLLEKVLPQMKGDGYAFMPEIVFRSIRLGFRVAQVPVSFPPRIAGKSKMSYLSNVKDYAKFLAWRFLP